MTRISGPPNALIGSVIQCPHCGQLLTVNNVNPLNHWLSGVDDTGMPNQYCIVALSDGASARMWRND